MAQKIKRRLFSGRKIITTLLALTLIGVALLSMTVFANSDKVTVTVSDAEGYVGDTVWVYVDISDVTNLVGVDGIKGGEIRIPYDASIASVVSKNHIELGTAINPLEFSTEKNNRYLDTDVLSVVWAGSSMEPEDPEYEPAYGCHGDGQLWMIKFTLKNPGKVNLALDHIVLQGLNYDTDEVVGISLENVNLVPGTITVKSYQLDQVEKPTWDGHTIKWNGVANAAAGYHVRLYKDGVKVWEWNAVAGASSLNLGSPMSTNGPGSYTATVMALAGTPYINGPESEHSDAKTYSVTLGQVGQPSWGTDWTITWNDLANGSPDYGDYVDHYEVSLVKDGVVTHTADVVPGVGQYTFENSHFDGPGSYTVTVQAISADTFVLDGELSAASAPKVRKEQLGQVGQPTWDATEPGLIKWSNVANAESYKIELLKSGAVVETEYTTGLSCIFLAAMRSAEGSYTVQVTALAVAGSPYEDGLTSTASAAKVVAKLAAPAKPGFSDDGVATWDEVAGANGYTVSLYKGGVLVEEQTTLPAAERKYDFLSAIRESGPGSYTVRVKAMGTGYDLNSDESAASDPRVASVLPAPTGLGWKSSTEPKLSWNAITGATGYLVQLYKGGTAVGSPLNATGTSYDFTVAIGDTAGYYTARVQAVGDDYFVLDSPLSALSATFTKTGPLGTVTGLALSDKGVATWVDEPDAVSFKVQLYKAFLGAVGSALNVDPGVQSADFRDAMRGAGVGDYYVSVTAIAADGSLFSDGNLFNSNDQAVSKLAGPALITFNNQGVFTWSAVANATSYNVTLNLPAGHPLSVAPSYDVDADDERSIDYLSYMRQHPGAYTVTVKALDTVGLYLDSSGITSVIQTVKKLDQVTKPVLDNSGVSTWADVNDAAGYAVALYKGAVLVAEEIVLPGVESFNFLDAIKAEGIGNYSVVVTALGDAYLVLDGDPSEASDPVTAQVLPRVNKPVLTVDNDTGEMTLEWDEVEGATGYLVTFYNGSGHPVIEQTTAGTSLTGPPPEDAGFYWVTVQAIGAGVVLDGPESETSDILVAFGVQQGFLPAAYDPPATGYVAEGCLPVPGYLWMQITSETGDNGVMVIKSSTTGAPKALQGLTAAGIFYDIELDEYLVGSHVLIKAGYGHVKLPQGMVEASLRLYRYDAEKGWVLLNSTVDTSEKVVTAEVDHFSTIGIFGEVIVPPAEEPGDEKPGDEKPKGELPRTFGYISLLLLGSLILVAAGLLFFRRRKGLENR